MAQAADRLGTWPSTITRWCESGKLPAIPKSYGAKTSYLIAPTTIDLFLAQQEQLKAAKKAKQNKLSQKPHAEHLPLWIQAMERGTLTGKVYSSTTIRTYAYYTKTFFAKHKTLSLKTLELELSKIPAQQFAKREKIYKGLLCLSKWLIRQGALDKTFSHDIKRLEPKRHLPPKRHTVSAEAIEKLIAACSNLSEEAILTLLAHTGLRASELCALKVEDIDMPNRILTVKLGKGNKTRRVGLNEAAHKVLGRYLEEREAGKATESLFLNLVGKPMDKNGLYQRLERIGKLAGVKVSPHSLRRAFVTINANAGRPLQMLQMACGHSDIKTTMGYCRTSEQEMITAMKEW